MITRQFIVTVECESDGAPVSAIARHIDEVLCDHSDNHGAPYKPSSIKVEPTADTQACTCDTHTQFCTVDKCVCDNRNTCPVHTIRGRTHYLQMHYNGYTSFLGGVPRKLPPSGIGPRGRAAWHAGWDEAQRIYEHDKTICRVTIRRQCLKCGYTWECPQDEVHKFKEPEVCPNTGCNNTPLGRIEVKS